MNYQKKKKKIINERERYINREIDKNIQHKEQRGGIEYG